MQEFASPSSIITSHIFAFIPERVYNDAYPCITRYNCFDNHTFANPQCSHASTISITMANKGKIAKDRTYAARYYKSRECSFDAIQRQHDNSPLCPLSPTIRSDWTTAIGNCIAILLYCVSRCHF